MLRAHQRKRERELARERYYDSDDGDFHGECYNCGEWGHMARDCYGGFGGGGFYGRCYRCGRHGHMARECFW